MTYDVATEMGDFLDRECSGPGCINSVSIKWNLRRQGILDAEVSRLPAFDFGSRCRHLGGEIEGLYRQITVTPAPEWQS